MKLQQGNLVYAVRPDGKEIIEVENISKNFINGLGISAIEPINISKAVIRQTNVFSYRWISNYREIITYMNNDDAKCVFEQNLKSFEMHCDYRKNIYYVKLGRLVIYIKYLHELQNLYFSLTQTELTIK